MSIVAVGDFDGEIPDQRSDMSAENLKEGGVNELPIAGWTSAQTHQRIAIVHRSLEPEPSHPSTQHEYGEHRSDTSPRHASPKRHGKDPEASTVKWRQVDHAIVLSSISTRLGCDTCLQDGGDLALFVDWNAGRVDGDKDGFTGADENDLVAATRCQILRQRLFAERLTHKELA